MLRTPAFPHGPPVGAHPGWTLVFAANKLNPVRKGPLYGFKHEPAETWDAGLLLIGDGVVGGIRRIFMEKVAGEYQGTAGWKSNLLPRPGRAGHRDPVRRGAPERPGPDPAG